MIPGLVLFKARQISWNKEQKQGFFKQKKNNWITNHTLRYFRIRQSLIDNFISELIETNPFYWV